MYDIVSFEVLAYTTLSLNSASKNSKIALLCNTVFAKTNFKI